MSLNKAGTVSAAQSCCSVSSRKAYTHKLTTTLLAYIAVLHKVPDLVPERFLMSVKTQ